MADNIVNYSEIGLGADIDLTGFIWNPIEPIFTPVYNGIVAGYVTFSKNINGAVYTLSIAVDKSDEGNHSYFVTKNLNIFKQITSDVEVNDSKGFAKGITFTLEEGLDLIVTIDDFMAITPNAKFEFICKSGGFNGNGHTITGMAAFSKERSGLFGNIHNHNTGAIIIQDVTMKNCVSQSLEFAGMIAGQVALLGGEVKILNNTFENCRVYGHEVKWGENIIEFVGAVVGRAGNSSFSGNDYSTTIGGSNNTTLPLAVKDDGSRVEESGTTKTKSLTPTSKTDNTNN